MAKADKKAQASNVDDLLGNEDQQTTENQASETKDAASETVTLPDGTVVNKAELEKQIKALKDQEKALKAALKGEKAKAPRQLKGQMVAFKNKAGEQIVGLGVLYYVARHGGKLHYKEASQVVVLPAEWKEGDPIPELPKNEGTEETTS